MSSPLLISDANDEAKVAIRNESLSRHRTSCEEVERFFECFVVVPRGHDHVARAWADKLLLAYVIGDSDFIHDVMNSLAA